MDENTQNSTPDNSVSEPSSSSEPIFKIEKLPANKVSPEKLIVKADRRKVASRANALKHGLYAKTIMADLCDKCALRPKDKGGAIGGCDQYLEGSVCNVKKDLKLWSARYDTRDPAKLREQANELNQIQMIRLGMSLKIEAATGNLNDKVVRSEINQLLEIMSMAARLNSETISAKQVEEYDEKGMLMRTMREVLLKKSTEGQSKDAKTN